MNEDVFYQPIPKFNTDRPLSECVVTISGIEQQEKDNISKLCEALGALVQKSLSSKNTGSFKQNTHLICKEPIGPKYDAARNWKMPVVYPEWAIECCVTGVRVEEAKFSVESGHNAASTQLIEILNKIRTNNDDAASSAANNTGAAAVAAGDDFDNDDETTGGQEEEMYSRNMTGLGGGDGVADAGADESSMVNQMQKSGLNDSSFSASKSESKKPRLEEADFNPGLLSVYLFAAKKIFNHFFLIIFSKTAVLAV